MTWIGKLQEVLGRRSSPPPFPGDYESAASWSVPFMSSARLSGVSIWRRSKRSAFYYNHGTPSCTRHLPLSVRDPYELLAVVGQGGMAEVWRVRVQLFDQASSPAKDIIFNTGDAKRAAV